MYNYVGFRITDFERLIFLEIFQLNVGPFFNLIFRASNLSFSVRFSMFTYVIRPVELKKKCAKVVSPKRSELLPILYENFENCRLFLFQLPKISR